MGIKIRNVNSRCTNVTNRAIRILTVYLEEFCHGICIWRANMIRQIGHINWRRPLGL